VPGRIAAQEVDFGERAQRRYFLFLCVAVCELTRKLLMHISASFLEAGFCGPKWPGCEKKQGSKEVSAPQVLALRRCASALSSSCCLLYLLLHCFSGARKAALLAV
jgi:hypothetical protein